MSTLSKHAQYAKHARYAKYAAALSLGVVATAALSVSPQGTPVAAPKQSAPIAILHATVHPMTLGTPTITDGFVLIKDGTIAGIGEAAAFPGGDGYQIHDATGLHLYPGFVAIGSPMGLIEVDQVRATDDRREAGTWHPEVIAAVAVNPDSELIPVSRANGNLTTIVFPQGGTLCGHASAIRMDGWTTEDLAIKPQAGMVIAWPATEPLRGRFGRRGGGAGGSRGEDTIREIDRFFDEATQWAAAFAADPTTTIDLRYQRLLPVLRGEEPVFIDASSAGQIESAALWATRRGLKPVIIGGGSAAEPEVAGLLKRHNIPVIVRGTMELPRLADDPYDSAYSLPARLRDAGIRFAIAPAGGMGGDAANDRWLPQHAGMAVAFGLTQDEAIAAITRDAASIVGLGQTHGTIEPGKAATLLLASGDPLDLRTEVVGAWIDGRRIDLRTNQNQLEERYREKYRQRSTVR